MKTIKDIYDICKERSNILTKSNCFNAKEYYERTGKEDLELIEIKVYEIDIYYQHNIYLNSIEKICDSVGVDLDCEVLRCKVEMELVLPRIEVMLGFVNEHSIAA